MSRSNDPEQRDLTIKAIRGDAVAFEQLYQRYTKSILYQARRFIRDASEAEDAAQEAVIEMYRNISTLKDPSAFVPWMYRLVKFVCLKHIRSLETKGGGSGAANIDDYAEIIADESKEVDPEKTMVEDEHAEVIRGIIERLPEKQREAVILFYYEGLSYREIAAAQGITASTVSTNIMKAKKKMAQNLKPVIAMAITADASAKLAGISIPSFQAACKVAVAKSAAAGLGHGAVTRAGLYAGKGVKSLSAANSVFTVGLSAATAVVALASVTVALTSAHLAEPSAPAAPSPVVQTPAAPYMPDAEIAFLDGDCPCGHVNPQSAELVLTDDTDMTESWEILSGADAISSGTGKNVTLTGLPDGDYQIRYTIVAADDRKVYSSRSFLITSEEIEDVLYL